MYRDSMSLVQGNKTTVTLKTEAGMRNTYSITTHRHSKGIYKNTITHSSIPE